MPHWVLDVHDAIDHHNIPQCMAFSPSSHNLAITCSTWWRHQMETFSASLVLCVGNSPVTGEFPSQRPVTRSFDVFFFICAWTNDWENNRDSGDSRRHRAHYDVIVMKSARHQDLCCNHQRYFASWHLTGQYGRLGMLIPWVSPSCQSVQLIGPWQIMTSSNGNIFRVTGPLYGEFTVHRWIPITKASDAEFWSFLWSVPEQTVQQSLQTPVMWDAIALIMTSL